MHDRPPAPGPNRPANDGRPHGGRQRDNRDIDATRPGTDADPHAVALRIAGVYALVALAWIWGSDFLTAAAPEWVQSAKGTAFVAITAAVLYGGVSRYAERRSQMSEEVARAAAERARQADAIAALSLVVLREADLATIFGATCDRVRATLDVPAVTVAVLHRDRFERAECSGDVGIVDALLQSLSMRGRLGTTQAVTHGDAGDDPRAVSVGILGNRAVEHVLIALWGSQGEPPDDDARHFLEAVATVLGSAVVRDRTRSELDAAELAERRRISEEIHDDPLQLMVAVAMRLELLARRSDHDPRRQDIEELLELCRLATRRLRSVMFELHPRGVEEGGLAGALNDVLARAREEGIVTKLDGGAGTTLPRGAATVLFQSAREAINNAIRHARAATITVHIETLDRGTLVRVADDGTGFPDGSGAHPGHLGLVTMVERIERAGGSARVDTTLGDGTVIELWVPHAAIERRD